MHLTKSSSSGRTAANRRFPLLALSALGLPALSYATQLPARAGTDDPPPSVVPLPPNERALPTTIAKRPVPVAGIRLDLEGPCFDRKGSLIVSELRGSRVMRLDTYGRISEFARTSRYQLGGMAVHCEGRVLIAASNGTGGGAILAIEPEGRDLETIVPESTGFMPNDLVFDAEGGFCFAHARGDAGNVRGGTYHVTADGSVPGHVLPHLALANGIALSPDGKRLWIAEYGVNRIHGLDLDGETGVKPFGTTVAYYFSSPLSDSMRADADGNVHVAMFGQGRVMVVAPNGPPIGRILLPKRNSGQHLNTTSSAIRPSSRDLFIVTADGDGTGATIYRSEAFGLGLRLRGAVDGPDATANFVQSSGSSEKKPCRPVDPISPTLPTSLRSRSIIAFA